MNTELIQRILTGSASSADKQKHKQLMNDESYAKEYEKLKKIWTESGHTFENFTKDVDTSWRKLRMKTILNNANDDAHHRKLTNTPWMRWAASIALIIGLGGMLTFFWLNNTAAEQQVFTADNTVREIILTDSTRVTLNKNAILKIAGNFNENKRSVTLEGEAFFNVAKNKEKPFEIQCAKTLIRVLGTSFNVNENTDQEIVEVNVSTGRVLLKSRRAFNQESIVLSKGERGIYHLSGGSLNKLPVTRDNYLSWKTGKIRFNDTPLDEVCETLSNIFKLKIIPVGKNTREILLTVSFKNEELEDILDVISLTLDATVVHNEDQILIKLNE